MNYRHAYHAGNFADVLKHVVLSLILQYMTVKPQPLRVIDVHAGIARYDLAGVESEKTREWQGGIGRLLEATLSDDVAGLLAPYLDAVRALNAHEPDLRFYPGSPLIARALMRRSDTLIANELHEEDAALLRQELKGLSNTKVMQIDAWVALKSLLPPPERRGLVLIDPPFEAPDEFPRLAAGLKDAVRRFANGTYLVWFPVKDVREVSRFLVQLRGLGLPKVTCATLSVCARGARPGLTETGVAIINPPYVLTDQLARLLPVLAQVLAVAPGAAFTLED